MTEGTIDGGARLTEEPEGTGLETPAGGGVLSPQVSGPDRWLVAFARALRGAGLAVPVGSVVVFAEALGLVGVARRDAVYWAGRATLATRVEDLPLYDRVFASFFDRSPLTELPTAPASVTIALDDESDDGDGSDQDGDRPDHTVRYSAAEVLAERDFAGLSAAEWLEAERLIALMRVAADRRRSRRLRRSSARRGHPDLRTTVRRSLRTGGVPVRRAWRTPSERPRRVVLLVDVSGSMEPYARALLRFAHAATRAMGASRTEVFALGTRLTRLSRPLGDRDPDAALARVAATVADWSGGTRLGDGLAEFNEQWGSRGMARGAVVVILSDGWDRGDPDQLGSEMARLHRVAHRVVWANPLKASPGYQPLARGMAAALPWVDDFVEGHTLGALQHLAAVVAGDAAARRVAAVGSSKEMLV
jgi:uncharacterized protein with von Willebrand factor type A (vWA) domain